MMMLATSVVALIVSLSFEPQIFWLTYFAATLFASAWGPVALMSIWSKKITAAAAMWGIISGFLGNVIPKLLSLAGLVELPVYLDPILIGAVLSLVTVLWVSRYTQVTEAEREYRASLFVAPEEDVEPGRIAGTIKIAHLTGAFGLLSAALLIILFILPYREIKGLPLSGVWSSPEVALAGSWILTFGFCAYLVIYGVRRSYLRRLTDRGNS